MQELFGRPVGISDHSLGIGVSICAVAFGANVVKKHFTLSRKTKTADRFFSIEPEELKQLVENIRIAEQAWGKVRYGLTEEERKSKILQRSLFVVEDISKGTVFSERNIRAIRPANGLEPKYIYTVLGRRAKVNVKRGTPLTWDLID